MLCPLSSRRSHLIYRYCKLLFDATEGQRRCGRSETAGKFVLGSFAAVVLIQYQVYGTKNLRIADLSVLPLHVAAHPQGKPGPHGGSDRQVTDFPTLAAVYAIAEQGMSFLSYPSSKLTFSPAADIIKGQL